MSDPFARVPLWILGRSDVSWPAKVLYGLISERPEASDDELASTMGVPRSRVRAWRRELVSLGIEPPRTTEGVDHATRARIIGRDKGACVYCAAPATTVDHVVPVSRGGSEDDSNLVACCGPCNSAKGDRLLSEWRRR